ncbi:MAG: hypothetical protein ABFC89_00210 [Methanospirillum sp.]
MPAATDNAIDPDRRTPADPTPDAVAIPQQLRRPDLRFVLVRAGRKSALEPGWPTIANYPHDHVTLALHLARGSPYGLFPAAGSRLLVVDADDVNRLRELGALVSLPETFAVASGSSTPDHPKAHLYYELDGGPLAGRRPFFDPERGEPVHLGEVFAQHPAGGKGVVIGPGSRHAVTGRPYRVLRDGPIARLAPGAWERFAAAVRWQDPPARPTPPRPGPAAGRTSFGALLGLSVDRVWPIPAGARRSGDWYRFAHPVHGSANGDNLAVHANGRAWYCHRCNSGGDALAALAVDAGIIDCADARSGCLADRGRMTQVIAAARARGLPVDEAERVRRRSHVPPPYESLDVAAIRARIMASVRGGA